MHTRPAHERTRFRRWQRRVFAIAWLSYASFYLCRVNLAVALPSIRIDLGWTARSAGLIASISLWVYALGQLINGTLGQRSNARWFVGLGMLVSALCNLAFGSSSALWLMALIWGLNGWAQSMGWGAIMKTIAAWFSSEQRGRISAIFSPCFVLGHLVAWSVGGWIASRLGWRYAFWIPGIAFAGMSIVWVAGIRSTPHAAGLTDRAVQPTQATEGLGAVLRSVLAYRRVRWAALICVFASMIKDGLTLWTPTYLVDAMGMSVESAALAASILPLLGLAGSMLAGWASDRWFRSHEAPGVMALSVLVSAALIGLILLQKGGATWAVVALLGLCGTAVYGINSLLLTSFPLCFSTEGKVGAVAGFLDFASYTGGGISALVAGQILTSGTWSTVFAYWLVATLIAFGSAAAFGRQPHAVQPASPID